VKETLPIVDIPALSHHMGASALPGRAGAGAFRDALAAARRRFEADCASDPDPEPDVAEPAPEGEAHLEGQAGAWCGVSWVHLLSGAAIAQDQFAGAPAVGFFGEPAAAVAEMPENAAGPRVTPLAGFRLAVPLGEAGAVRAVAVEHLAEGVPGQLGEAALMSPDAAPSQAVSRPPSGLGETRAAGSATTPSSALPHAAEARVAVLPGLEGGLFRGALELAAGQGRVLVGHETARRAAIRASGPAVNGRTFAEAEAFAMRGGARWSVTTVVAAGLDAAGNEASVNASQPALAGTALWEGDGTFLTPGAGIQTGQGEEHGASPGLGESGERAAQRYETRGSVRAWAAWTTGEVVGGDRSVVFEEAPLERSRTGEQGLPQVENARWELHGRRATANPVEPGHQVEQVGAQEATAVRDRLDGDTAAKAGVNPRLREAHSGGDAGRTGGPPALRERADAEGASGGVRLDEPVAANSAPAEPASWRAGEPSGSQGAAWVRRFENLTHTALEQMVRQVEGEVQGENASLKFQLAPGRLGELELRLEVEQGVLAARFVAASEEVRALIESALPDLRRNLAEQGISVGELSVSVGQNQQGRQPNGEAASGHAPASLSPVPSLGARAYESPSVEARSHVVGPHGVDVLI